MTRITSTRIEAADIDELGEIVGELEALVDGLPTWSSDGDGEASRRAWMATYQKVKLVAERCSALRDSSGIEPLMDRISALASRQAVALMNTPNPAAARRAAKQRRDPKHACDKCDKCGALIADKQVHTEWHEAMDRQLYYALHDALGNRR